MEELTLWKNMFYSIEFRIKDEIGKDAIHIDAGGTAYQANGNIRA